MGELKATPWESGTDMFGAHHVYNSDGRRITNDQMCGTEGWEDACHIIAALPDLYAALEDCIYAIDSAPEQATGEMNLAAQRAYTALAKARGEQ